MTGPVPPPIVDVLVAGAGPAGAAVATHLAAAGLRVVAVDRAAFPRDKPCSEYVSPGAVRLLDRLGVLSGLAATGAIAPTGMTVFVIQAQHPEIPVMRIYAGTLPFLAADFVLVALLIVAAGLALWLPKVLY